MCEIIGGPNAHFIACRLHVSCIFALLMKYVNLLEGPRSKYDCTKASESASPPRYDRLYIYGALNVHMQCKKRSWPQDPAENSCNARHVREAKGQISAHAYFLPHSNCLFSAYEGSLYAMLNYSYLNLT